MRNCGSLTLNGKQIQPASGHGSAGLVTVTSMSTYGASAESTTRVVTSCGNWSLAAACMTPAIESADRSTENWPLAGVAA